MKPSVIFFVFLLLMAGCGTVQVSDQNVDTELGIDSAEQAGEADETLSALRDQQLQDQKRQLERQINDPLISE